jgi:hypothetical protein
MSGAMLPSDLLTRIFIPDNRKPSKFKSALVKVVFNA